MGMSAPGKYLVSNIKGRNSIVYSILIISFH